MLRIVRQHQKRDEKLMKERVKSLRGRKLGVYIHIPFCKSKCAYCDFYSLPCARAKMDVYQKALLAHIEETAPRTEGYLIDTVYIGGGTPSFYGAERLKELLRLVHKRFALDRDCEITVEVNPDSVDKALLNTLRKAGVNRISMGVQSAQERELKLIERPHTFQQTQEAVQLIRQAKIKNLNLDLIYGLPEQTMESWQDSVEQVLALKPEHLSLYALTLEEGTPLYQKQKQYTMADDDAQADRYLWAVDRLAEAGYAQYEISNFAQTGRESRHNLKYWKQEEYIGFGPGAHSDFGGRRYSYIRDLDAYCNGMLHGGQIVESSDEIPLLERSSEYLMLRLRTTIGIEEQEYRSQFRMNFQPLAERMEFYRQQGWAVQTPEHRWHFTPNGFLLSNQLIGELQEIQEKTTMETVLPHYHRPNTAKE